MKMIHPTGLLRSDSDAREFSAPVHFIGEVENDWGISKCPCLSRIFNWRKFANAAVYVAILSFIGLLQGALLSYFRNTVDIWSKRFNISKDFADYLIYLNDFFAGILALFMVYLSTKIHKTILISVLLVLHGCFSALLIILELVYHVNKNEENIIGVHMCEFLPLMKSNTVDGFNGAFALLIFYQIAVASACAIFFTVSLVYIDDNVAGKNSVILLVIPIALRLFGQQLGIYLSWIPTFTKSTTVFYSVAWMVLSFTYIFLGGFIAMFPKRLPSELIKQNAASIVELASGGSTLDMETIHIVGFKEVLQRLLKNKILIISIISTVTMQAALINFSTFEYYFLQSRFLIADNFDRAGFINSFSLKLTTNLMEKPFIIISTLLMGLIISKTKVKVKHLIIWNIVAFSFSTFLFSINLFLKCKHNSIERVIPYCSVDCGCSLESTFNPVCLNGTTYYSPCHAGCQTKIYSGSQQLFSNCLCNNLKAPALEGACNADTCNLLYNFYQFNNIIILGILQMTVVTNLIIILRSVRKCDKIYAVGLEITLLALVPFFLTRIISAFAGNHCQFIIFSKCRIYGESFSDFIAQLTVFLMITALICQFFLLTVVSSIREKLQNNSGEKLEDSSNSDAEYSNTSNNKQMKNTEYTTIEESDF